MKLNIKHVLLTSLKIVGSVWVPLIGIAFWYRYNKQGEKKTANIYLWLSVVGFFINLIPRLIRFQG